ncbi:ACN9-domain-containing protein [Lepidopterella palustris CBS 459.81]|uniref:Succinate dehydrogenase assembly factor 3 n=1 Tax=Lepidopterella palustris CBS 459.81 TaxID=1314670 RepID=A0A8E2ECH4_9PEZI|nr:ACN9-domain-containing protein [Lepidopterella palustris CBS 459.81]
MKGSLRLWATATAAGSARPLRPAQMALLPPIPLYRRLLRAHRMKLPLQERLLGDQYIKSEFRAHRDIENPVQIIGFLTEWQLYAQHIEGETWKGARMEREKIDKMSDQQIGQLYELMKAIRNQELEENDPEYNPDK